ncbi:LysR family transcriptional regulator [Streptantibioticus parmotrematis]|uniref:LysR family transcriptional regulator n=1 Tax=Streptantibioticus parmotrematis TaxID=2873249 RepID=UPI0033F50B66
MQLDLNLLTALDALLEEGSVQGAAARLHVTAPAMSRTLGRLRKATGDEILVRVGRTMVPTAHAQALRARVHDLVHQAQEVLMPVQDIELATLERVFTIRWHEALTTACGPGLVAAVRREAPRVQLRFLIEAAGDRQDPLHGEVDLESSSEPPAPPMRHRLVGEDTLVAAVRPDHALATGRVTPERYAAAHHVTISRRGRLSDPVDAVLAARGLERTVAVASASATTALQLAADMGLVVTVPDATTREARARYGLVALPLPFGPRATHLYLTWHHRFDNDRAHTWLRDQACTEAAKLFAAT